MKPSDFILHSYRENRLVTLLGSLLFLACLVAFVFFAILPMSWPEQLVLGLMMVIIVFALRGMSRSHLVTLTLTVLSLFATARYGWWRLTTVTKFLSDPTIPHRAWDSFFVITLIIAELYAFVILVLGYLQTIYPLHRAPVPLPANPEEWPDVDLIIPTYDEPLSVVKHTAFAALNVDWPLGKLHVHLLDDGHREEFRQFSLEAGIGYISRDENRGAKAGNINHALAHLHSPYVAIFDCDHVPTRSFLQVTMGWFLRDPKLALVQTPHHFYSPDPFERNLGQFREVPNEGELFYGIVQDGNDFWNAAFFCGSCAVLNRSALDEIGGIATETVTEDAHTSLRLQKNGWNTAYINIPQAAGLATERLAAHVKQRIRWARGMMQIFRRDNPVFARGLKLSQRLCYLNAMLHFMYALPRLIFLTAPLIYLLFGYSNIPGYWLTILAYSIPHLVLGSVTNSRVQGRHRHSFWNEIYETVLAPYILLPTCLSLINPKLGKFNVTAKGGTVNESYFDLKIAKPFLFLLMLNVAGLVMAVIRYFYWDVNHPGTVLMNVIWVLFNIAILGVALAVAQESRQRRRDVRIDLSVPAPIELEDGEIIHGETLNVSSGGAAIRLESGIQFPPQGNITVHFFIQGEMRGLPARVVAYRGNILRIQFSGLTIAQQEQLTVLLYSRADSWLIQDADRNADRPLHSFLGILRLCIQGLTQSFLGFFSGSPREPEDRKLAPSRSSSVLLSIALGLTLLGMSARAEVVTPGTPAIDWATKGAFHESLQFRDIGVASPIEFHGVHNVRSVPFSLSDARVVKQASVHLYYQVSSALLPQSSSIKVTMNGTFLTMLQLQQQPRNGNPIMEQIIPIPADLIVRSNQLAFEFVGHYTASCEDPKNGALWGRIDNKSSIDLSGDSLPLADDLRLLPTPFLDSTRITRSSIPVVFPERPSREALRAAGIVASYFGVAADYRQVRFPIILGNIPSGNAIVIAAHSSILPASLNLGTVSTPTLAIRQNPNDPFGKLLIVTGGDELQLVSAAQSLAINSSNLRGSTVSISQFLLPAPQQADAAPRWAQTDHPTRILGYGLQDALHGDGSAPMNAYFRIPPDLYYGDMHSVPMHIFFRYNSAQSGARSFLSVEANRASLGSIPLPGGGGIARQEKATLPVPVSLLRPFSNTLMFNFNFQDPRTDPCQGAIPGNTDGSILGDSYLDLHGLPHYVSMPNLELFSNAGFPFTRYADLHETTVVMPPDPSPEEIELFLSLMAHFGAQTGYPALHVGIGGAEDMHKGANRDFLVLGIGDDQPAFDRLEDYLPVMMSGGLVRLQDGKGILSYLRHLWWKIENRVEDDSRELTEGGGLNALIEGIESPYSGGRSIVLIHLRDAGSFESFLSTFLNVSQSSVIAKSVSVMRSTEFRSFWIGENSYHVGSLSNWKVLSQWFMQAPWLIPPFLLLLAFVSAWWMHSRLRRWAFVRLQYREG